LALLIPSIVSLTPYSKGTDAYASQKTPKEINYFRHSAPGQKCRGFLPPSPAGSRVRPKPDRAGSKERLNVVPNVPKGVPDFLGHRGLASEPWERGFQDGLLKGAEFGQVLHGLMQQFGLDFRALRKIATNDV
jgi:hypothetical protein